MSSESGRMGDDVGKEQLPVWWTTVALVMGHSLLAAGLLLLLVILVFTCIRRAFHNQDKACVPLPTPPVCRRHLSIHPVYPPTPPITRQQLSIYTICRPTPPDSPLISTGTLCKSSSSPSFLSSSHIRRTMLPDTPRGGPGPHHLLPGTPPLLPHKVPPVTSLPSSPELKATRRTNSLPMWPQEESVDP